MSDDLVENIEEIEEVEAIPRDEIQNQNDENPNSGDIAEQSQQIENTKEEEIEEIGDDYIDNIGHEVKISNKEIQNSSVENRNKNPNNLSSMQDEELMARINKEAETVSDKITEQELNIFSKYDKLTEEEIKALLKEKRY
jgi:hypothetical protein